MASRAGMIERVLRAYLNGKTKSRKGGKHRRAFHWHNPGGVRAKYELVCVGYRANGSPILRCPFCGAGGR